MSEDFSVPIFSQLAVLGRTSNSRTPVVLLSMMTCQIKFAQALNKETVYFYS